MGTPFSTIIDMALVTIQDYKIDKLYETSQTNWETYLSGFVALAIPNFTNSAIDLAYNATTFTFDNVLGASEIDILAYWTVYQWFTREVQNVSQFNLTMTPNDFKRYAESQNLREKSEYKDRMREIAMQKMVDYGMRNIPWQQWGSGNFGG